MELSSQHYQEVETSKMVLDRVQMIYQTRLMEYDVQEKAPANLIKQLKNEKEATKDKTKLGIKRIWMIVAAWRERTKTKKDVSSSTIWNEWSWQAVELQILRADEENQKRTDENFYKMNEESIVTI